MEYDLVEESVDIPAHLYTQPTVPPARAAQSASSIEHFGAPSLWRGQDVQAHITQVMLADTQTPQGVVETYEAVTSL